MGACSHGIWYRVAAPDSMLWCAQAMDRCHRIGQLKPVLVFRLATALSVEGKLLRRANSKLALERLVIKKGAFLPGQVCRTCCSVLGCSLLPSIGESLDA